MCAMYSPEHRKVLLDTAAGSIQLGFVEKRPLEVKVDIHPPELQELRNAFVTLYARGDFRGCIGSMRPIAPLVQDVAKNAYYAAFMDRRVGPLNPAEFSELKISISVLSAPEPLEFLDEEDLVKKVRSGIDGLIVYEQNTSGTLLPSVWEHISNPREFVRHVKAKAGLPTDYWSSSIRYSRYTTESFSN